MASPRTIARLEAQIQRRIAHCLQFELADPRSSFVTVVRVELNTDLSTAKVHYSVLGDEAERSKAAHMLDHAKGFVRRQMGSVLRTKTIPDLRWVYDSTIADAEHMDHLLEKTRERDRKIRETGEAPEDVAEDAAEVEISPDDDATDDESGAAEPDEN